MTADTTTLYITSQVASRDILLSRPAPTSAGIKSARYNGVPKIGSKESVHFERGEKERGNTETKREGEREEENSFGFPVVREFLRICVQCRL
jgi:hypothetical protein